MRFFVSIFLIISLTTSAQVPPSIQWQKSIGGSDVDIATDIRATTDGGYIIAGSSFSNDGNITGNHGGKDAWIVKIDFTGNIQWQKSYGGDFNDEAWTIRQTLDGGYIFTGSSFSNNGDVHGNHGTSDVWVVKLDVNGIIQWQKCFGGAQVDFGETVRQTSDGGYIIGAVTSSHDGNLSGNTDKTCWLIKLDNAGNIQWQKPLGNDQNHLDDVIQTSDGGYMMMAQVIVSGGDVTTTLAGLGDLWIVKLDNAGNIQWQKAFGGNQGDGLTGGIIQTSDGGYVIASDEASTDLPGHHNPTGHSDVWVIKLDAAGVLQWQKCYGGNNDDWPRNINLTPDGGYIIAGSTSSNDGDICNLHGFADAWILKLKPNGDLDWQKTIGGNYDDGAYNVLSTTDGGYISVGHSSSTDGDILSNHGGYDFCIVKMQFPGTPLNAAIHVTASETNICPGKTVRFVATPDYGGSSPSYQWQLNGVNSFADNDTIFVSTLNNHDVVSCILTSNSACVSNPVAISNNVSITIDPALSPKNFLPADSAICIYATLELKANHSFYAYSWSNNLHSYSINITQPGIYWLDATDDNKCVGRDSIVLSLKDCPIGFYIPTAFTPNGDGVNDSFSPLLFGHVKQFHFNIFNRWGQLIFQTKELNKGWNGMVQNKIQDTGVFLWTCTYQFEGEAVKNERGTILLIK